MDYDEQPGFTIVELLIVIVVIGILAAISIVAYSGIQQRATAATLTSDLNSNSKLLKLFQVDYGAFPVTFSCAIADSATNKCLKSSSGNVLTYQYSNTNPQSFCINASKGNVSYRITNDTTPVIGDCFSFYATGGTMADIGGYRIHTFTSSGTFTVNAGIGNVEALVVAGGGSGGTSSPGSGGGGGGGAGGLIYNSSYSVTPQSNLSVTVGSGGAAVVTGSLRGLNGGDSIFGTLIAIGGGGGGYSSGDPGAVGGSGGGAGYKGYTYLAGALGTPGQGNKGGDTLNSNNAGGGGGAGGVGGNTYDCRPGTCTTGTGGPGGLGLAYSISGTSITYAKGGEGGSPPISLLNGAINTGNGGTGVYSTGPNSGSGGSGIVIIRYLIP